MSRLYGVLPWGLIALGTLHMAATWRFYHELTSASLWFFNGGLVFAFVIGLMATITILSVMALGPRGAPPR